MKINVQTRVRGAFTIVEMLVVIGIITILVAMLLPALSKARAMVMNLQCLSNLHQIDLGILMYAADNRGSTPDILTDATGNVQWPEQIGGNAVSNGTGYGRTRYVPYDWHLYSGTVWTCPFATIEIPPWYFVERFSFHYSMNAWTLGVQSSTGTFSTSSDGIFQCKKIALLRPDVVLVADGTVFPTGPPFIGAYFVNTVGYLLTGGAGGIYGGGNSAPWPVNKPLGTIPFHNQTVNLAYADGSASSIYQKWDPVALKRNFCPFDP